MLYDSFGTLHVLSHLILMTVRWVTIIIFTFLVKETVEYLLNGVEV